MGVANLAPNMQFQFHVLARFLFLFGIKGDGIGHGHDEYEYSPYHYEYKVHDDKEYLDFGQEEEDDGHGNVHGYYHVQLPDGRHQRVDYHVDGYSGFIADVKYDGKATHPVHHSSGHHGRFGKSLNIGLETGTPQRTTSSFGRQGKALDLADDLHISETQFKPQIQNSFGKDNRRGKSLTFKSKTVEISKQDKNPTSETVERQESAQFFARAGKSLNSENENSFGFGSSSDRFGPDFGSFQSSLRKGKSPTDGSKDKKKQSSLITRKRIERAGVLETSDTQKQDESKKVHKKEFKINHNFTLKDNKAKVPDTFFEFVPKNTKSPFPSNFYEELVSKNEERQQKKGAHTKSESGLKAGESEYEEEIQMDKHSKKQTKGDTKIETEAEESRLPVIRGKIIYGP